jgi:hypothetical protein
MTTKSREYLYGTSIRMTAERAREDVRRLTGWPVRHGTRMLGYKGPAQPSPNAGEALNAG